MPRGRRFVPPAEKDGLWFVHRGCDDGRPLERQKSTVTGGMLASPFHRETCEPPKPPHVFQTRSAKSFKTSNEFSAHDNRELLASDAEYFGMPGLRVAGRKLVTEDLNQHNTDPKLLAHYGRQLTRYDYNTLYSDNYRGCQSTQPSSCCRSFPRQYPDAEHRPRPDQTGCVPPTSPDDDKPCRPTTELLAVTQKPYIKNSGAWKYSYNSVPCCYPAGFGRIDSSNPYPGFYLRPPPTSKADVCDVSR